MEHIGQIIEKVIFEDKHPITTGYKFLDEAIGGYYPGELTTVCGEEDSGKTAFVIAQLFHIVLELEIPTLLIMNNMSKKTFIACMVAFYCSIETKNVHNVLNDKRYKDEINECLNNWKQSPLYIINEDTSNQSLLAGIIDEYVHAYGIKIVFVDEISCSEKYSWMHKVIVNDLKKVALRLNIPIVNTTCIWNDRVGFDGMRPFLKDVYFSSEVHGQDTVIGLTRYDRHEVYEDINGRNLNDKILMEILKAKGYIKKRKYLLPWDCLYSNKYGNKEIESLISLEIGSHNSIESLVNDLDFEVADEDILPF